MDTPGLNKDNKFAVLNYMVTFANLSLACYYCFVAVC